jgi:hypothetical protein
VVTVTLTTVDRGEFDVIGWLIRGEGQTPDAALADLREQAREQVTAGIRRKWDAGKLYTVNLGKTGKFQESVYLRSVRIAFGQLNEKSVLVSYGTLAFGQYSYSNR